MRLWLALCLLAPGARAAVPKEARRHFLKAAAIQKGASKPSDYELAAVEYRKALELAPKYVAARYNLALALESEGSFDEAIAELRKYETLRPAEKDAVEDKIAGIEGKKELAANQEKSAPPAQSDDDRIVANLDGAVFGWASPHDPGNRHTIEIRGGKAHFIIELGGTMDCGSWEIKDRAFSIPGTAIWPALPTAANGYGKGYIAADGESISMELSSGNGFVNREIFHRR